MKTRIHLAAPLIALSLAAAGAAFAQSGDKLGKVDFPNSCNPAVQEKLLRGIAMLHSFYYSATQRAFEEVAAEDNSCAIACCTLAVCTPSAMLADTVTTRLALTRLM